MKKLNDDLFSAVLNNNPVAVMDLLSKGADVNATFHDNVKSLITEGYTPLMIAARQGKNDCLSLLINHGADVDFKSNVSHHDAKYSKTSALILAAMVANLYAVKALVEHGADINQMNTHGNTALTLTCANYLTDSLPVVQYLIQNGANMNHQNETGMTPLMMSLDMRNLTIELLALLVDQGADIHLVNNKGEDLSVLAIESNRMDVIDFIKLIDEREYLMGNIDPQSTCEHTSLLNF